MSKLFVPSRSALALVVVTAAVVMLTACSDGTATTNTTSGGTNGASGGTFVFGSTEPDGDITPQTTSNGDAQFVVGLANAKLVAVNTSGALVPELATAWKASPDGLTWTVTLRSGAKFSDGKDVKVADVVASYHSILAADSQSPAKSSFTGIVKSVSAAPDSGAAIFTLERAYSDFPYLLSGADTNILPAGVNNKDWINRPVGAGQFILEKYTAGEGVTYKKNPYYWGASKVKLDSVDIKFYADPQSELLAFQSGEIDEIRASTSVNAALDVSKYREIKSGYIKFDGIVFNVNKAPFNDVKVRQAVAWALDRKAIVDTAYDGDGDVANDSTYFPDYAFQPKGVTQRSQDLAQVKQLLDGRKVSFTITTYQVEQTYAEVVQQQLQATGFFTVKLKVLTAAAYYADGASTPWLNADVTITDWGERLPSQYIGLLYGANAVWNASHYSNPALESLATRFDATTDPSQQQDLSNQIATIQWTDVPVIVPAFLKDDIFLNTKVKGTFPNGLDFPGGYDLSGITVSS